MDLLHRIIPEVAEKSSSYNPPGTNYAPLTSSDIVADILIRSYKVLRLKKRVT